MNNNLKKALWFSRHNPTKEQLEEIESKGYILEKLKEGLDFGARNLLPENLEQYFTEFCLFVKGYDIVFGVFPPKLRSYIKIYMPEIRIYESWNVSRTVEGGKLGFKHHKFCETNKG